MGKYSRLGKNTLLVFIGNAGAKLIGLLMLPFYTRWLSVEDYGVTDLISVYVSFLLGLVSCCITESIFIFPKGQSFKRQKEYFSSGLLFSVIVLLITAFLFQISEWVFTCLNIKNSFTKYSWFVYGMLSVTFIQQYIQQFTRSINRIKVYSVTGIVLTVSTALFSFLLIPKWGVNGFVLAIILANVLATIYSFVFSHSFHYFSFYSVRVIDCIEMLKYSVPLIPNGIMWWLVGAFNRPLMENYLGMHSIGIFAVANKFPGILAMMFTVFSTSWQISVIEEFNKDGYNLFFNKVFRFAITGLVFFFLIITICSKLIISVFASSDFYEAWRYIPILTLGVIFSSVSGLAGSNFSATRESKYFFYSSLWGAVASIIFNFLFIPSFATMGAAISFLFSFIVMAVFRLKYAYKYIRLYNCITYFYMVLLCVFMILIVLYIQNIYLYHTLILLLFTLFIVINRDLKVELQYLYLKIKD